MRPGLVAFDLDGTLTRGPSCLESIAAANGFADRMAVWETSRTEAEIRAARVGVWPILTGLPPDRITGPLADIPLAPGVFEGLAALRAAGVPVVIVSLTFTLTVSWFAERFGIVDFIGTRPHGRGFRHVFPWTKPVLLAEFAARNKVAMADVVAVGDSVGDVPMLRAVGRSVFVGPALPAGLAPTWHLPGASIATITALLLKDHQTVTSGP
ncbi:haloacid dehalogenase-like hydrolase [Longispora sp. K20-0274]|uniref:HAD family hydrolase n=1 Tax=Longispora sp. K20-0274 TaxID=3088255 RepID=UPI00399A9916